MDLEAPPKDIYFEIWIANNAEYLRQYDDRLLWISYKVEYGSLSLENIREFVSAIKVCAGILKTPGAGFDETEPIPEADWGKFGFSKDKDICDYPEALLYRRVWPVLVLTPDEVQKFGYEKLKVAPCEVIEELEDGGMFLMLGKDRFSAKKGELENLRRYLGKK